MDFTLTRYHQLLYALLSAGYSFQPFSEYLANPEDRITIHPQRWTSNIFLWSKELITQNLKNQVKRFMVK